MQILESIDKNLSNKSDDDDQNQNLKLRIEAIE